MAAIRDFGSVVYTVLDNMSQSTSSADSSHAHRARRAVIDAINRYRDREFHWSEKRGSFQSTAGKWEYNVENELGINGIARVAKLWYSDDATGETLCPHDDQGVRQTSFADVHHRAHDSSNSSSVDYWAWWKRSLKVTPKLDGNIYLFLHYVLQPKRFAYKLATTGTTYFVNGVQVTGVSNMDQVTDEDGMLDHAFEFLAAEATRDLYMGHYQSADPKKSLSASWGAIASDLLAEEFSRRRRARGSVYVKPYFP